MSVRFHPRQSKSRNDSMVGPDKVFRHGPRATLSRRDGYAVDLGAQGNNPFVSGTVAVTGAGSLGVKSLVAGGSDILFTLSSSQDVWRQPDANTLAGIAAGLTAGFNATSLSSALTVAAFSVDVTRLKLNVHLPAVAAYSPGAGTAFLWTFPKDAFRNSPVAIACASALVVTSAA